MVTTALKRGQKTRVNFGMRTGNTRRLRVTLLDLSDNVLDAEVMTDARFTLDLSGGQLVLGLNNGITLDRSFADGKARPVVNIEAGATVGEPTQNARYEFVPVFADDHDSVLYGRFEITASLAEPDETAGSNPGAESRLDAQYTDEELLEALD